MRFPAIQDIVIVQCGTVSEGCEGSYTVVFMFQHSGQYMNVFTL